MTDIEIPTIEPVASPPLGTPWVPLWPLQPSAAGEVDYVTYSTGQIAVPVSAAAAAVDILTSNPIVCDGSPLVLEFSVPLVGVGAGGQVIFNLWIDGVDQGIVGQFILASMGAPFYRRLRIVPSAGTHTYKLKAWATGNAGTVYALGTSYPGGIFMRVTRDVPNALPLVNPTYGTSFPASPANGMEHILVDSVTAPTYQWRFRYNAGNTTAYKWEFIGGSPIVVGPIGGGNLSTTAFTDVPSGPTFTFPRAGSYLCQWIVRVRFEGAASLQDGEGRMLIGSNPGVVQNVTFPSIQYSGGMMTLSEVRAVAAGELGKIQGRTQPSASTVSWANPTLIVNPVRVS